MGILEDGMAQGAAMQQPAEAPQQEQAAEAGALPPPNPEIMSPIIQGHMGELEKMRESLTGDTGDAYDRVLTAGMKMMYAPQSAEMIQGLIMDDKVPVANKLGEGVANLLVMMDNQGNGTIPKEVLIPVGVALMFEAADYLYEVQVPVTEEDLGKALELMINGVFIGYGIDPSKMDEVIDDMAKKLDFKGDGVSSEASEGETASEEVAEGPQGEAEEEAAFNQGFSAEQAARQGV